MKKTSLFLIAFLWLVQLHAQQVHAVSAMRKVMMGEDLSAHLFWDTIPHQNLYGISPSGRIEGKITIIDGQFYNTIVASEGRILMLNEWKTAARKKMGHLERISFQQPVLLLLPAKPAARTANINTLAPKAFKKTLRKTKNAVLLDVRTPDEFAEGHLKNAQNIDYLADEFEAQVSRLDKSKPCFLYCRSGKRTAGAAELMLALGFERIYTLDGGMLAWEEQKLPVARPATQH